MPESIELTAEQRRLLREALTKAFVDFDDLRRLVRYELDDRLTGISRKVSLEDGVDQLIEWAEANARVGALSAALGKARKDHPKVIQYLKSLSQGFDLPTSTEFAEAPADWKSAKAGLEALVHTDNPLVLATEWREAMRGAETRVCRIEGAKGNAVGTGFLVGEDLILTNCHVYRLVHHDTYSARFDCVASGAEGVVSEFKSGPPLAVSTEDKLDFALLRLASGVGKERGWFKPKAHSFKPGQVQLILQHALGDGLQVGIGQVTGDVKLPPRITYSTNTEHGSSGSPIFTMNWQVVAIHHYGGANNNVGIPLVPIWEMLTKENLVDVY